MLGISIFIFLSCKDDDSILGFPNDPRLHSSYVEIPVKSSVVRYDGLITQKLSTDANHRLLVGKYTDPEFGAMEARAYTSLGPPIRLTVPSATATFDSLVLQLRLDFYLVGNQDSTEQVIQIYEPLDTLNDGVTFFTNNSSVPLLPTLLGEKHFGVDPEDFLTYEQTYTDTDSTNDKSVTVKIKINGTMGPDLFNDLVNNNTSVIQDPKVFNGKYKGFGIVMSSGDKILGIAPTFTLPYTTTKDSRLTLYYTDAGVQSQAQFVMDDSYNSTTGIQYNIVNFSTYTSDRTGTPLDGLQGFTEFVPSNGRTYVQGGPGLITKLDFSEFYKHLDTVKNAVFNSAELVVTNVGTLRPPTSILLRVLDSTSNEFASPYLDSTTVKIVYFPNLTDPTLKKPVDPYYATNSGAFVLGGNSITAINVQFDEGTTVLQVDGATKTIHTIFITELCQRLYNNRQHPRRATTFSLLPNEDEFRKSVSSLILEPEIKLRLYYAQPVIKIK